MIGCDATHQDDSPFLNSHSRPDCTGWNVSQACLSSSDASSPAACVSRDSSTLSPAVNSLIWIFIRHVKTMFVMGFLTTTDFSKRRLIVYDIRNDQPLRQKWAGTTYGVCVAAKGRQPWSGKGST
ncbi:hypothetical protein ElyMa_002310200 [Elysia marginata]|uniref:Uncharacterized protein n=1 Tax=Elysia marginata TaxID=1093978 RepID=A0AAV4G4V7_9GAST|nr:hypothetical protein ElyMa_002310200 [Elysia marginata]